MKPSKNKTSPRIAHVAQLERELGEPPRWCYMSFADNNGFLGAAIVRARIPITALERTHKLGMNPGGEVAYWDIAKEDEWRVPKDIRNRLLTEAEVQTRLDGKRLCD